ncbi:hypothetical protein CC77DRAFT_1065080 [Alternaria alternata]|uniref:Uncharacterized protein n=1 Tax=Alternaria alternata TaxID=5599 RepID=A0A177DBZ2_ALTAL|nr:hypothetical protein CC77DRAFT_1065080 [Alternaria alternata]OAG16632.1 hypothetical protein CC77DRAFT_1065080 [Alternaria alternata]
MSGNEGTKTGSGWTDKERLTYLFTLIENSNVKFDYNNTPRPAGRSIIACQRMIDRLKKAALKDEVEALTSGDPGTNDSTGTPKKTPTPRKRKAKGGAAAAAAAAEGEADVKTPTKRGRKKKELGRDLTDEEIVDGDLVEGETIGVKPEPKEEGQVGEDF